MMPPCLNLGKPRREEDQVGGSTVQLQAKEAHGCKEHEHWDSAMALSQSEEEQYDRLLVEKNN